MIMSIIETFSVIAQNLENGEKTYQKPLNLIVKCDSINSQSSLLQ